MVPIAPQRGCARRGEALTGRGREMAMIVPLCRWEFHLSPKKNFWPSRLGTGEMNMQNVGIFIFREGFTENALGVSRMNMQHRHWQQKSVPRSFWL
jgi:hypothetical protein